jgi:hypothetical protein
MGKYQSNGYVIQLDENADPREILSPCLKFLREKIDNHLDVLEVLKIQYQGNHKEDQSGVIREEENEGSSDEDEEQSEVNRVYSSIDRVMFSGSCCNYLFGKSVKKELLQEILLERKQETFISEDYEEKKQFLDFKIRVNVQDVLTRLSLPIGEKGNLSVPSSALYMKSYMKTAISIKDEIFSNFIKDHVKPEPITNEDKELEKYFNEVDEYCEPEPEPEHNNPQIPTAPPISPPIQPSTPTLPPKTITTTTTTLPLEDLINNENNIIPISLSKVIRFSMENRTNENYFIKIEFNKQEDLIYADQIISKGYFENKETEVVWSDSDAYSEDETRDEENYHASVAQNFKSSGTKLFRSNVKTATVDKELKRNYEVTDFVQGVWSQKKDTPLFYLQKNNEMDRFGFIVMRISWIPIEKSSISSLEKALKRTWNWKLVKIELP